MEIPVYIGGAEAGRLTLAREGLYLVLRADCEARPGFVRLWLHGAGGSAYLGLLAPEDGRLRLERRYTRAAAAALPEGAAYASDTAEGTDGTRRGESGAAAEDDGRRGGAAAACQSGAEEGADDGPALLLPCAPSVPGARLVGGRWVLAISPPSRYNEIFHTGEGGTGHADDRADREKT